VLAGVLTLVLLGLFLTTTWLVIPWTVGGSSMTPALESGDRVLVDLWSYRNRAPRVGEIILMEGPRSLMMVKRVDALTGPAGGEVLVSGDNQAGSLDSRTFGAVRLEAVKGRVVFRYWPLSESGPIR
jgi:signal peptidase I